MKNFHRTTKQQENIGRNLNIFGISDDVMLDPRIVKIICGIAGSAKSSNIDKFFRAKGIDYARFTSTNKLKRDAQNRYGCYCDTIAGGLFHTDDGLFFSEEKDSPYENIVIDEILQTDIKVIEWVKNNYGDCNIIVTTDSHQMLSSENGKAILS